MVHDTGCVQGVIWLRPSSPWFKPNTNPELEPSAWFQTRPRLWSGPVWGSIRFGPEPWHLYDGKDVPAWGSEWQADMQHKN